MSYMEHSAAFSPTGGIQELSFTEVDQVSGSGVFLVAIVVVGGMALGYLACEYIVSHC